MIIDLVSSLFFTLAYIHTSHRIIFLWVWYEWDFRQLRDSNGDLEVKNEKKRKWKKLDELDELISEAYLADCDVNAGTFNIERILLSRAYAWFYCWFANIRNFDQIESKSSEFENL